MPIAGTLNPSSLLRLDTNPTLFSRSVQRGTARPLFRIVSSSVAFLLL